MQHKKNMLKKYRFFGRKVMKVDANHYLGYENVIGARIKYIITLVNQIVGAINFCSTMYRIGPRDEYIGWDNDTRTAMLSHLENNNIILILPWIKIYNSASRILSLSLRQLRIDWEKQVVIVSNRVEAGGAFSTTSLKRVTYFDG